MGVVVHWCCIFRSLKKNINELSHKIFDLASKPNGGDQQLVDQLSDELQKQQAQLVETKSV